MSVAPRLLAVGVPVPLWALLLPDDGTTATTTGIATTIVAAPAAPPVDPALLLLADGPLHLLAVDVWTTGLCEASPCAGMNLLVGTNLRDGMNLCDGMNEMPLVAPLPTMMHLRPSSRGATEMLVMGRNVSVTSATATLPAPLLMSAKSRVDVKA